jgi:hypothetical protein
MTIEDGRLRTGPPMLTGTFAVPPVAVTAGRMAADLTVRCQPAGQMMAVIGYVGDSIEAAKIAPAAGRMPVWMISFLVGGILCEHLDEHRMLPISTRVAASHTAGSD